MELSIHRRLLSIAATSVGALVLATVAQAQSAISIINPSFESPVTGPPFFATPTIDGWEDAPPPNGYDPNDFPDGLSWDERTGAFLSFTPESAPIYANQDGNQVGYVFILGGAQLSQTLTETFQEGLSYDLTIGVRPGVSGAPQAGNQLQIGLSYLDGGALVPIASATTVITYDPLDFPEQLLYDYTASLAPVQAGDAWAGKEIGIQLTALNGLANGTWDLDNVRLTVVPEPSSIALLLAGLAGGIFVLRRRKV